MNIKQKPFNPKEFNRLASKVKVILEEESRPIIALINDYSSASSRSENEYQRGISAGIEMFRKYLLRKLK